MCTIILDLSDETMKQNERLPMQLNDTVNTKQFLPKFTENSKTGRTDMPVKKMI